MRSAFHFSSECTVMAVSVDIYNFTPSGLPFCSIPPFTTPTMIPREPQIILPPVVPPDLCHCITFLSADTTIRVGGDISTPAFNVDIRRCTEDCCNQQFSVRGTLDIPCMPFNVQLDKTIHVGSMPAVNFTGGMVAGTAGECRLSLNLDIQIPGVTPVNLEMTIGEVIISVGTIPSLGLDFTQPAPNVWELDAHIRFPLGGSTPPIPVSICNLFTATAMVSVHGSGIFQADLYFGASCTLYGSFYVSFPHFSGGSGNFSCGLLEAGYDIAIYPTAGRCLIQHTIPDWQTHARTYNAINNLTGGDGGTLFGIWRELHFVQDTPFRGHYTIDISTYGTHKWGDEYGFGNIFVLPRGGLPRQVLQRVNNFWEGDHFTWDWVRVHD